MVAVLVLALLLACPASAAVVDTFERGDEVGWSLVGDGNHMSDFSIGTAQPGSASSFCLKLTSKSGYWCGVQSPSLSKLLPLGIESISLDAKGSGGCRQLCIDIQQSDGGRWWKIADLPADGGWQHISVTPAGFFPIANPTSAPKPDLTKPFTLWFAMRLGAGITPTAASPATMGIDNIAVETATKAQPKVTTNPKAISLRGVTALVAETSLLPGFGQDGLAPASIAYALKMAGADVEIVYPGRLSASLKEAQKAVLVWEGPACAKEDWEAVRAFLGRGGALLWLGAGQPFSRSEDSPTDERPAQVLTKSAYHAAHVLNIADDFTLTDSGKKIWPDLPSRLPPQTCRYLTTNDSIYLNTHWPWVDVVPLVTLGYKSRSWIWADDADFIGTPAVLYRHHSGEYAGARVALLSIAANSDSVFSPANPAFPYLLSRLVKELAAPQSSATWTLTHSRVRTRMLLIAGWTRCRMNLANARAKEGSLSKAAA